MAKRKSGMKEDKQGTDGQNGGIVALTKELFQAAIVLRGSIEPADYKRYVLPIIFLRFLSLRYDRRRAELETLIADKTSDYYKDKKALTDPDEYRRVGAFIIPEGARWQNLRKAAQADDIKVRLDDVLEALEAKYPAKLKGLLPRIYAGSNLDAGGVRGLINLFSKDIFEADHGGDDLIGRVYEYFIGEFASSEGKRGGEYFTPVSIVKTLVAMLEPEKGVVFDPCCGSGGMFVQSDLFTKHSKQLSFCGQESKEFTYRLCRMNLFIHGIDGNIQPGNSYFNDQHATLKAVLGGNAMCHSLRRAIAWVLVGQIAAAAAPLYARQTRAHHAVFTVEALKKTVARAAATTQTAAIDERLREQWAKVQRLERGAKVLVAVEGQALARRSVRDVYDDAIVLAAADGIAVRVARDDIDQLVVPAHGSQPAAVAMGFLGFFFGFAAAATSAPNKPVAYTVILGTPIAFGMAGYHGLRTGDKVLYARP